MRKKKTFPKKDKPLIVYKGLTCDSDGELQLLYYIDELQEKGYIKSYKRGSSYLLSDSLVNSYIIQLKTRSKPKHETILLGHSYTLDFEIEWTELGVKYFCNKFGEKRNRYFMCSNTNTTFIEAKPPFDFNNMTRLAVLNTKWMWQKYNIFVQIVNNKELFEKTFVPNALLLTKTGKNRTFNFEVKSLEEFVKP